MLKSEVLAVEGWKKVIHFEDDTAGLKAIIAVHDATLGPGCGGCRIFPYARFEDGLEDVKKLSRGMTFKNALGGIPFGGGKAVIFADPKKDKTPALLEAFGRAVDSLDGLYYTAEDSGVTEQDLEIVRSVTKYAAGMQNKGIGGNPSPFTARGVWRGMQAAARKKLGVDSLKGLKVSILGVGAVGMELARLIHEEGGKLVVADVNQAAVKEAVERFGAETTAPEDAIAADVDIFSPCALGGSINELSIKRLKAKIVAGAANNQLKTPDMDQTLADMGVLYCPDYVINAAGVISVGMEITGAWTEEELTRRIDKIGETLSGIFERAENENAPTGAVADRMALEVISNGAKSGLQANSAA
ncbi:Glu/Leu/Phe/Val dehydrogenase dimerization domain-containing protein [Hyphococcus flavus]|uniref:Glu/Leu/Phe/Val dehydrogenase dimerization domain-containing protein n=1 Tax=Hyphococcus flavus TaxID=1866326 RepID=A0AAE9ZAS1_9PROT|nr:Glu/Leu/Phe/Val dehydrogenase dimerization domain-containing protein [Hyphococcus flavus]WDI30924.1 Glu/Leu/Phe/Val dehydrogenase dimerization domain-containing protein [Hyphococcus flavus]